MIEVRGLTKRYGSTVAVDRLSFEVPPGAVTGFLGLNGSGKSTTMRMILGLDSPDAGHARIGGQPYHRLRWPLREAGALLESRAFHPGRSARAHLAALAASNSVSQSRVAEVLEIAGLESAAGKRAGKFSLGMAQRLGIAAALPPRRPRSARRRSPRRPDAPRRPEPGPPIRFLVPDLDRPFCHP